MSCAVLHGESKLTQPTYKVEWVRQKIEERSGAYSKTKGRINPSGRKVREGPRDRCVCSHFSNREKRSENIVVFWRLIVSKMKYNVRVGHRTDERICEKGTQWPSCWQGVSRAQEKASSKSPSNLGKGLESLGQFDRRLANAQQSFVVLRTHG